MTEARFCKPLAYNSDSMQCGLIGKKKIDSLKLIVFAEMYQFVENSPQISWNFRQVSMEEILLIIFYCQSCSSLSE